MQGAPESATDAGHGSASLASHRVVSRGVVARAGVGVGERIDRRVARRIRAPDPSFADDRPHANDRQGARHPRDGAHGTAMHGERA